MMYERNERMVSPTGRHESFRTAHFLTDGATSPVPDSATSDPGSSTKYKELPFNVNFLGWKFKYRRQENWREWLDRMKSLHHSTWEKAGISDAIVSSTYEIQRNNDLIFGFSEKWCPATNSFVFPWGEATITLEDAMILGGYSVLGEFALNQPGNGEIDEIVEKLRRARSEINKSKSKKALQGAWMDTFMGSDSEIEHEAFLAYWLSRFVFPISRDVVSQIVLPVAVRLAKGTRIAIAPAVLASIYRNLTLLKVAIVSARKAVKKEISVSAPLALVQVWIWERFPSLRPIPNPTGHDKPRLARWHDVKSRSINVDVLHKINSAADDFQWRPYLKPLSKFHRNIYKDNDYRASIGPNSDDDLQKLVRWLRPSELIGIEPNCIEQYLPHRVTMQFGLDQDVPGHVERVDSNPEVAWSHYCRPVRDAEFYVPPRVTLPCVTTRYLDWWRGINVQVKKGRAEVVSSEKGSSKCLKRKSISANNRGFSPPCFARNHKDLSGSPFSSTANNCAEVVSSEKGSSKCLKGKGVSANNDIISPPPGFAQKSNLVKENVFGVGIKKIGADVSSSEGRWNNQFQECSQNTEVNPSSVKSSTDELFSGMEARIRNIEKLCAWIKAGKLDMLREIGKQSDRTAQKEN